MKRKILALILVIATLATCVFTVSVSAAEEESTTVVKYVGHQRTVVADDTYGIRFLGTISDLSPSAVGFDLAIILNDGTRVEFSQEETQVFKSIIAVVDGEEKTVTAEELGGKFIFAVTIANIPSNENFKGYLCSPYYKDAEDNKTSCETEKVIYNGADRYGTNKLERVYPTYIDTVDYTGYNSDDGNDLDNMWDGIAKKGNGYTGFYGDHASGKIPYSVAKFANPTVIERIALFSAPYGQVNNKGITVEASVTGEDGSWVELWKESGELSGTTSWNSINTATVTVTDSTAYSYIRVVGGDIPGVYLSEVEVYAKTFVPYEFDELTTTHHSNIFTITDEEGNVKYTSSKTGIEQNNTTPDVIWDGDTGTWKHTTVWRHDTSLDTPFSRATLGRTTIDKIVVKGGYYTSDNNGCEIQASPDNGTTWVTLHKISSDVDATGTTAAWRSEDTTLMSANAQTVTYYITNDTEFTDIRVYGNKFSFIEIDVFGSYVSYSDTFATSLNTPLS